jgi:hypothetical protein
MYFSCQPPLQNDGHRRSFLFHLYIAMIAAFASSRKVSQ